MSEQPVPVPEQTPEQQAFLARERAERGADQPREKIEKHNGSETKVQNHATVMPPLAKRLALHKQRMLETEIEVELGSLDSPPLGEAALAATKGLVTKNVPIFQRAGALVHPVVTSAFNANRGHIKVVSLVVMDAVALKAWLMRNIKFTRRTRDGEKRFVNPGREISMLIVRDRAAWLFPSISALISSPTLRPDGSLLSVPGYDASTGLLLLNSPAMPLIALRPTRADAKDALRVLIELLVEFPFCDEDSRSVALSLILSVLLRGALDFVPLHLITATSSGSGKSFIVDIASMIATGKSAAVVAATRSADELEKRIGAELMTGRVLISIDNLNGVLSSELLCQSVTQDFISFRRLGSSSVEGIGNTAVFCANGNNIQIADDLARRTILAQLDAKMEKPWDRPFKQDPIELIAADRGKYIGAALTISLAYLAAGEPEVRGSVNGFKRWDRFVRSPLVWLGEADPISTMKAARDGDPGLQVRAAVLNSMASFFGPGQDRGVTAAQIVETVSPEAVLNVQATLLAQRKALREALIAAVGAGKEISPVKLGYWLKANKGQIIGGQRLWGELDRTKTMHWWVEEVKG